MRTSLTMFGGLLLVFPAFFSACTEREGPAAVSQPFVRLQADLLVAREEARLRGDDSAALGRVTDSLFRAHAVTEESYREVLEILRSDLARWKAFNESVGLRLDTLQKQSQPPDSSRDATPGRPG